MAAKVHKTILIKVSEDNIKNGVRHKGFSCPVALAIHNGCRLPTKTLTSVMVGQHITLTTRRGLGNKIWLDRDRLRESPRSVKRFISRFDDGKPVKPFTFKLPLYKDEVS